MDTSVKLDSAYWDERYRVGSTGWDLGDANPGLVDAVARRLTSTSRVLIPGAGRAHEARALWKRGSREVFVLDWSAAAIEEVRAATPAEEVGLTPEQLNARLLVGDFFTHRGQYEVLVEQTFFCAIAPARRGDYVRQAANLLKPGGRWIGLLFDRHFPQVGPPFGGSLADYRRLFGEAFEIETLAPSQISVPPRRGSEVFGVMRKR